MQEKINLRITPKEAASEATIRQYIAAAKAVEPAAVTGFHILKKSLDARSKQIYVQLTVNAFINEPFRAWQLPAFVFPDVRQATRKVMVVGAGPAGIFAALQLIQLGIQPIIIERGKDVRSRRRDLAAMNKQGIVNPESNYSFGEGGAGTYSDGKLYTRSNKRGNLDRILQLFVHFGAEEKILYEAHPHIGTNKLPNIITAMRQQIEESGGLFLFEHKLVDFTIANDRIASITCANGQQLAAEAVILATGHSARDIFELLHAKKIAIEAKPFALGVRIEHPQSLIDNIQLHCAVRDEFLPPAAYSLVEQVDGRGVFSFCMCPGGIIAPASTAPGETVVNGWSPSKRNNAFANSGLVVNIELSDAKAFAKDGALSLLRFQQKVEQAAFAAGGAALQAPAQRMVDFVQQKTSTHLPDCSYLPGLTSSNLHQVLPTFVASSMAKAFAQFGKKMRGYFTNEAVLVATESRTSSPVRIPRNADNLQHPQIKNLYPCGEGAGYAGGIVSAAMDGERIARMIGGEQ
jgi:uncharacterized protein